MISNSQYLVVDLFAGPGGLGEGFSSCHDNNQKPVFINVASIEKDSDAYATLLLRHFFRSFKNGEAPDDYYRYISGAIKKDILVNNYPDNWLKALSSAFQISLGDESCNEVKKIITNKLGKAKKWVLVGGPPCQAYSLVGRSRRIHDPNFELDEKHFLYREYLKIINDHRPPVFMMENVKGLLSARIDGESVAKKILSDLSNPQRALGKKVDGLSYKLYSLGHNLRADDATLEPESFIVRAEEYGVPQARHRMFILGVRSDIDLEPNILKKQKSPKVKEIIGDLPAIRSGISKCLDSYEVWLESIFNIKKATWYKKIIDSDKNLARSLKLYLSKKNEFPVYRNANKYKGPSVMRDWYIDKKLKQLSLHESRSHMLSDLYRYFYAAVYAATYGMSPKLSDFPRALLPKHKNVVAGVNGEMFSDRFRVQLSSRVSTTITSHISKDGHYFIHYDPTQCRSLTVREAARLQTFPDNYYFEGTRTSQYHQVGNAVPPYLANQISYIVKDLLDRMKL